MRIPYGSPPKLPRRGRRPCRVADCSRWAKAKHMCGLHLNRHYKHGDPNITLTNRSHDGVCSVAGCGRPYYGNGLCRHHNDRFRAHGSPTRAEELAEAQGGLCAICGQPPRGRGHEARLHFDHDHETGQWRGMLCGPCNKALGLFRDDVERMRAAIEYVVHHRQEVV